MRLAALAVFFCSYGFAVEFNRDVRPILSDKCFLCHGPDAANRKIPLRLDIESAAKADLGGRRAIVEGNPEASELVERITADKPARKMPPVHSGLKLTDSETETLRQWIQEGARWQSHWAFIAPKRSEAPAVNNISWVRNPIDQFVLARLEKEGLTPTPQAAKETLIRRVSLDLSGLPPTPAEVKAFVDNKSPRAYEKVVDRLLASPRYAERMAARWLDAARYADTNGYQFDGERVMWRWRDWVIDAFNRNQPYNEFALEQIAGDMLPDATMKQKIATGFNRNHRANTEDGIIPEEYAVEYVVDRVETTSTVFLGLTLGCARCHNHKYDPFTQKEFYQVFAYFNNVPELGRAMKYGNSPPVVPAPTAEQETALREIQNRIAAEERVLSDPKSTLKGDQGEWEKTLASAPTAYWAPQMGLNSHFALDETEPAKIGKAAAFNGERMIDAGDAGKFDIEDRWTISAWIRSENVPDGSLVSRMADDPKGKGYGIHADNGKIHVNITSVYADDAIRVETEPVLNANKWQNVLVTYTGSRMAEGLHIYVDGKPVQFKVLLDSLYRPFNNAGARPKDPFRIGTGWGASRRFKGQIDDVRIYERTLEQREIAALGLGVSVNEIAAKASRSSTEKDLLRWYYLENAAPPDQRETWSRLATLRLEEDKLRRTFPTVMVMAERTEPRKTHLLVRGAYNVPGEMVDPGAPAVLTPLPEGAPNNRLGFAKWVVDPANPLTARVAVNRFWQMYFGAGLVRTTEDFGSQGEWPSHPELLDWLATEFVRTEWDTKAMQKLIVTSATYRQSSKTTSEAIQRDPENRLLARGPRFRLPAEIVRDQALFVAGLLKEKIGGPSVKPYQPDGLWRELTMQGTDYEQSKGDDLYRRSMYTYFKRTVAPPMLTNFDAPGREACTVRDTRTNTPLQALNLMNDVTFLESARFVGQRMMKEGGADPASRLEYGFRLVLSREPTPSEQNILRDSFQYHLDFFSQEEKAKAFLKQGDSASDAMLSPRELAAYAAVGSLLLNMDEAITKE